MMRQLFFWHIAPGSWANHHPSTVALEYGRALLPQLRGNDLPRSPFTIALSTSGRGAPSFEQLTKRAALVSDTLLLSHDWTGPFHDLDTRVFEDERRPLSKDERDILELTRMYAYSGETSGYWSPKDVKEVLLEQKESRIQSSDSANDYGMHCPDLAELGRWILNAKPLLKAGLVWYLPCYSVLPRQARNGQVFERRAERPQQVQAVVDYLIRDGRAVDASGATPIKSHVMRPILQADLPFIEGVSLRDFSAVTVNEFTAYSSFRDFMRMSFLELDDAMNAVESELELVKLGLRIKDEVRAARSQLITTRRKRAVRVTGAVIGSVTAALVAVYGPELADAVAWVGAGGGVLGAVYAATENSTRPLRENKWYYVWVLAKKCNTHFV